MINQLLRYFIKQLQVLESLDLQKRKKLVTQKSLFLVDNFVNYSIKQYIIICTF